MARAVSSCLLEWDSRFLGLPVGRITDAVVSGRRSRDGARGPARSRYRARVWAASAEPGADLVRRFGGRLVDRKITWTCDLASLDVEAGATAVVQPYAPWMPTAALERPGRPERGVLAVSRRPPHAGLGRRRALSHVDAPRAGGRPGIVLVAREATRIAGVVTVGEAGGGQPPSGYSPSMPGLVVGGMVRRWSPPHSDGLTWEATPPCAWSRKPRTPACRLYEQCGFRVATMATLYHFWLRPSPASRNA